MKLELSEPVFELSEWVGFDRVIFSFSDSRRSCTMVRFGDISTAFSKAAMASEYCSVFSYTVPR